VARPAFLETEHASHVIRNQVGVDGMLHLEPKLKEAHATIDDACGENYGMMHA